MRILAASLLVAAIVLSGCTGSSGSDPVTPEQDDEGRYIIKMLPSNKFSPKDAQVPLGATVVWINEGGSHNTQSEDGIWTSGSPTNDKGEIYAHTFDEAGTITVV